MWLLLFIPPVVASLVAYRLTKKVKDLKSKLALFWLYWTLTAMIVHSLLLPIYLLPIYPALAGATYFVMQKKLEGLGRARGELRNFNNQ